MNIIAVPRSFCATHVIFKGDGNVLCIKLMGWRASQNDNRIIEIIDLGWLKRRLRVRSKSHEMFDISTCAALTHFAWQNGDLKRMHPGYVHSTALLYEFLSVDEATRHRWSARAGASHLLSWCCHYADRTLVRDRPLLCMRWFPDWRHCDDLRVLAVLCAQKDEEIREIMRDGSLALKSLVALLRPRYHEDNYVVRGSLDVHCARSYATAVRMYLTKRESRAWHRPEERYNVSVSKHLQDPFAHLYSPTEIFEIRYPSVRKGVIDCDNPRVQFLEHIRGIGEELLEEDLSV